MRKYLLYRAPRAARARQHLGLGPSVGDSVGHSGLQTPGSSELLMGFIRAQHHCKPGCGSAFTALCKKASSLL